MLCCSRERLVNHRVCSTIQLPAFTEFLANRTRFARNTRPLLRTDLGFCETLAIFRASNPKNRFLYAKSACFAEFVKSVCNFGGIEPPKLRGCSHAPLKEKISSLFGVTAPALLTSFTVSIALQKIIPCIFRYRTKKCLGRLFLLNFYFGASRRVVASLQ